MRRVEALNLPYAVNWHITYQCNYSCSFCFFRNPGDKKDRTPKLSISIERAYEIIKTLRQSGVKRINFAGGEPTLVKEFPLIVNYSHSVGIVNTVVTNGTGVTEKLVNQIGSSIRAVKLSIDSADDEVEKSLGRGYGQHISTIIKAADIVRKHGVQIMANTVVTSQNWREDMHNIIERIQPIRWKVFQVLPVKDQNLNEYNYLKVTENQFSEFVKRHGDIPSMVLEDNSLMTESYLMIDPLGRFFQNKDSKYTLSESILEVGLKNAFAQISFDQAKYVLRERGNEE